MKSLDLSVSVRNEHGKGVSRRLRMAGEVPAIFYGRKLDPISLSFEKKVFNNILGSETGRRTFLRLIVDGEKRSEKMAIIKEMQVNPITGDLIHVDFFELLMDKKLTASVPLHFVGKAIGVEKGGAVQHIRRELHIKCLPDKMPESIDVDVTSLDIGQSIHIDDINLPEGIEAPHDVNFTVAVLFSKKGSDEDEAEAGEEEAATEEASE